MTENVSSEDILGLLHSKAGEMYVDGNTPEDVIQRLLEGMKLVEETGFDGRKVYVTGKVVPTGELVFTEVADKVDLKRELERKIYHVMVTATYHFAADKTKKIDIEFHIWKNKTKHGKYKGSMTLNLD